MHEEFWRERWQKGQIGFHEAEPNALLKAHLPRLLGSQGQNTGPVSVLVPLSGKSNDLALLASHGAVVTGVEIVRQAAEAFFAERGLEPARGEWCGFETLSANGVRIALGDFFSLDPSPGERFHALYDRAALIAVRPEDRPRYVAACLRALRPRARLLLVTLHLENGEPKGPPFSISEREVRDLYAGCTVELIDESDLTDKEVRFRERGATRVLEQAFLVTAPAGA